MNYNVSANFAGKDTEGRELYVSRSGNDTQSCDQWTPCQTIERAVTLASGGDEIHIRDFKIQRRGRQRERQKNNRFN